ncbi:MAG TPA: histidine phosphatase family protein [Jatrophihabitans sp.]|uniref:histidine phosphatase family protein n=1 Tax=Jatrophihabitans sp. TaxID=1932789 RepID=UPI002E08999E|nr:histidine phosphatase family protein [Jatrophihabitans sp.]
MRRLVLLRHGRTAWNAQRRFQGHADPPLDEVGRAQAWEVAAIIAALRPGLLASSSADRATQTAAIVGETTGLPVVTDPRFRERGLGHWEGLTLDEVSAAYPDEYAEWVAGQDVTRRGGETRLEVAGRALEAFAELPVAELTVLVTHGATAMAMCNAMLGIPQETHLLAPLANCHWSELFTEERSDSAPVWRMRGHNLGAPGMVVPLPAHPSEGVETSDADA